MKRREFLKILATLPIVIILFGVDEAQEDEMTTASIWGDDWMDLDILFTIYGDPTTRETFLGLDKYITTGNEQEF